MTAISHKISNRINNIRSATRRFFRAIKKPFCNESGRIKLWIEILIWSFLGLLAFSILGSFWIEAPKNTVETQNFIIQCFNQYIKPIWIVHAPDTNKLNVVKTVLTAIGGMGAIAYLVIHYRERIERERVLHNETADRRLNEAVQQLGSDSPQVRIAGVYALADVSDTYKERYKQRVVNILCGYLRTDRSELNDAAVESTILQVMREHLLQGTDAENKNIQVKDDDQLWTDYEIDLHGATISEKIDFMDCKIGAVNFNGARFNKDVSFSHAILNKTDFATATFARDADFAKATFKGLAYFGDPFLKSGTTFEHEADFSNVTFEDDAYFSYAIFIDEAGFINAVFTRKADFFGATFNNKIYFFNTTFEGETNFSKASFEDETYFGDAASDSRTVFKRGTYFCNATLRGKTYFVNAMFQDESNFTNATFEDEAYFDDVTFKGSAQFQNSTFTGKPSFKDAKSYKKAYFSNVKTTNAEMLNDASFKSIDHPSLFAIAPAKREQK